MQTIVVSAGVLTVVLLAIILARGYARRSGARALLHHRASVDRFKLASLKHIGAEQRADPVIVESTREHARATGVSEAAALARVDE